LRFAERARHRFGDDVGVHDHLALDVARGAADRLDQRGAAAQIAFLIGIEDADERDLGQIEAFAQQIDADQHVELALAQIAQDRDPLERLDFAVQVAHLEAVLEQIVGEVFGHLLRERRDQHALVFFGALANLVHQIVDLMARRPHLDFGIDEARRPDDHLDDLRRRDISYVDGVADT
jgi:hypothetical protein